MNITDTETEALPSCEVELLNPEQLARKLSVTRRCLSNWTRDKIIPMIKIGRTCRFDWPKVKAALEKYEQAAATR